MMTFSKTDLAKFFSARSREGVSAEQALKDLEARGITGADTVRKSTPRALCDSVAQRAGRKLSELSSHELARILRGEEATSNELVICESADGWSLHAPGSTDEQIASGDAPPLADGPWTDDRTIPDEAYEVALDELAKCS